MYRYASITDLTLELSRPTTKEEVNAVLQAASESGDLEGVMGFEMKPLVSSDYKSDPRSGTSSSSSSSSSSSFSSSSSSSSSSCVSSPSRALYAYIHIFGVDKDKTFEA